MSSLPTPLRRQLESSCKQARTIASIGAQKALEALAVHEPNPYGHMDEVRCKLREKLRAQARQLGDVRSQAKPGVQEIRHLVEKLAYDQWHRLLFARFLLENNLLISPEHEVSVSLDDCEELAPSLGLKDAWAVAARFAAKELPQIFRADDSAGAVELAVEDRKPLIQLVTDLPVGVFTASDSLGWCYQFWQAERKDEINAAGNKIGGDDLPAVTQLFTEDYMVDFLLDNTLGAWHAGNALTANPALAEAAQSEEEVRAAVALPGCRWKYLRFVTTENGKWTPAVHTFNRWPKTARELKCLDPCMGSGHFVVAMFDRLLALRMAEEGLGEAAAVKSVICDNLFGLEIDPRCTQIAAFNLALAAWRRVGHCVLPAMNLACSGLAPNAKEEDWLNLAGQDYQLQNGMERLYRLFKDAPVLGSLINPRSAEGNLLESGFHDLQPLLEQALAQESRDDTAHEMAVTARGLAKAAEILAGQFTLIATNVPYLGRGKQDERLQVYAERVHPEAKADLATTFLVRCLDLCAPGGSSALVTPQHWLFLGTYKRLRALLLDGSSWNCVARLGPRAFETISGEIVNVALTINSRYSPSLTHSVLVVEASELDSANRKALALVSGNLTFASQDTWRKETSCRLLVTPNLEGAKGTDQIGSIADSRNGLSAGDGARFEANFWEIPSLDETWEALQSSTAATKEFGGRERIVRWENEAGEMAELAESVKHLNHAAQNWRRGKPLWHRVGIIVNQIGAHTTIYTGDKYDGSCFAIVPNSETDTALLAAFAFQGELKAALKRINPTWNLKSPKTLLQLTLDLGDWRQRGKEQFPGGLPRSFSSDPTQWLFNGHSKGSDQPLHVAVARLLGYRWPRQTGSSFHDCPALDPDGLEELADRDGIVCLSAAKGKSPAAESLRGLLVKALGKFDTRALIGNAGPKGSKSETLDDWLRDEFFEQHCALFQHRPFIWHIWDGHKTGFSALANYHKLTHGNLETITYAYLGDWIRREVDAVENGESGSDARLQAAKKLQARLKLILEGEPPYDLFVRWKPLSKQAIGWHPDLNDGVRMNIRPFAIADILRKPVKIKWDKDRGKEPTRDKKNFPWFWGWDEKTLDFAGIGDKSDGNRWNDCHYTSDFKRKARGG